MFMSLDAILQLVATPLQQTEDLIQSAMASDVPLISDINEHIIQGGKRIRPITALLIAGLLGDTSKQHIQVCAIIEFLHTATLLHDDVIDNSDMRRGQETANNIWGNEASVLVGDFLYSRAFQLITELNNQDSMKILADASNVMSEGEVLQLMNRHNTDLSEEIYYRIINAKTATLFEAACALSAIASNASKEDIKKLKEFGKHLGIAFQLIDDALDYLGNEEQLGKNIGDDLAEGKATLPLIHACTQANAADKAILIDAIATGEIDNLSKIKALINKHQSTEYTLNKAKEHSTFALNAIEGFSESPYKSGLHQLLSFVTSRNN